MSEINVKMLCEEIQKLLSCTYSTNGASYKNVIERLPNLTVALNLTQDIEWKTFCAVHDSLHATQYLNLNMKEQVQIDGRKLKELDEKEITLELIKTAIKAYTPLTPSMIRGSKKIKDKLTNEFIAEILTSDMAELRSTHYVMSWLNLWNKKGPKLSTLIKFEHNTDWFKMVNFCDLILRFSNSFEKHRQIMISVGFPEFIITCLDKLKDYSQRYYDAMYHFQNTHPNRNWRDPMPYVPFSLDEDEEALFSGRLRMAGKLKSSQYDSFERNAYTAVDTFLDCLKETV